MKSPELVAMSSKLSFLNAELTGSSLPSNPSDLPRGSGDLGLGLGLYHCLALGCEVILALCCKTGVSAIMYTSIASNNHMVKYDTSISIAAVNSISVILIGG